MVGAIKNRELITVQAGGVRLRGTHHKTQDELSESPARRDETRVGVLFVNSGYAPRAGNSDTAAFWADSFANCGYPSFRLDMPGLGDSDGRLPATWMELSNLINNRYFVPYIASAAKSLTELYHLTGVVVIGHCGGAVSAIHAGAESKHIKGVVALDPYFFQNQEERAALLQEISFWATRNKMAAQLSAVYRHAKKFAVLVRGEKLPVNTNLALIRSWLRLASTGTPMLVLNACGPSQSRGQFDYFRYLQESSGSSSKVAIKFVQGAHHSFGDNLGRAAVRQFAEQWLNASFRGVDCHQDAFPEQFAVGHQR